MESWPLRCRTRGSAGSGAPPARKLWRGRAFALCARGGGDRFPSVLRPDPAPLRFWEGSAGSGAPHTGNMGLRRLGIEGYRICMSSFGTKQIQRMEEQARTAALDNARRRPSEARAQQLRVSLVGVGSKWRITNLEKAVKIMASWR